MRIKRFYESEEQSELSVERVGEITDELVKADLSNAFDKLDTTLQNFKSYTDEGRKYLYTETK